jgi:hypothetical protein
LYDVIGCARIFTVLKSRRLFEKAGFQRVVDSSMKKGDAGVARVRKGAVPASSKHGRDARGRIGEAKDPIAAGRVFSPAGGFFSSASGVDGLAPIDGEVHVAVVEAPVSLVPRSASCFP